MDLKTSPLPESIFVVIALYGVLFVVVGLCAVLNHLTGRPRLNGWLIGAGVVMVMGGYYLWAIHPLKRFHDASYGRAEAIAIATVVCLIVWPAVWRGIAWRDRLVRTPKS